MAAICEIILKRPESKILVCANSNSACDELATRLKTNFLHPFLRLYATSYKINKVPVNLLQRNSNIGADGIEQFSLEKLYGYPVIVCTMATAAITFGQSPHHTPTHFQHIMFDESASTHETMIMAAVAGMCYLHFGLF